MTKEKNKKEELNNKLTDLEKNFGLKKASDKPDSESIYTDIYALDYVLDRGIKLTKGGHKIEFYGRESSGKTTMALLVIKKFQELGKTCVYIEVESYDKEWGAKLGVNNKKLLIARPNTLEEAGELLLKLLPSVDLIVVDSIVNLEPELETERDLNKPTQALQARVNSVLCRKINSAIAEYNTTLIFINQIREKLGVMYGNPETTPGGKALKHLYNTRIEFKSGKFIEKGTNENKIRIGVELELYGKKNKLGTPQRKAIVDFYYTGNIDNKKSLFYAGVKYCIISLQGKTYTYKDFKAVGLDNFITTFTNWKDLEKELHEKVK